MAKFLKFLYKLVNLYLYFVVMACLLTLIPNINPNYPLFDFIFTVSGFYLIPPIFGFYISPMFMLVVLTLISMGIAKLYNKYDKDEPKVINMSPEEFSKKFMADKDKEISEQERKDNQE